MLYRRIRDKNTKVGMFHSYGLDDYRNNTSDNNNAEILAMDEGHRVTSWVDGAEEHHATHYFKPRFYKKHKHILVTLVEDIEDFEMVTVCKNDIKKIYFEDENQILVELYENCIRELAVSHYNTVGGVYHESQKFSKYRNYQSKIKNKDVRKNRYF